MPGESYAEGTLFGKTSSASTLIAGDPYNVTLSAVDLYKFHTTKYPGNLNDLLDKPSDNTLAEKWAGPYIDGTSALLDPWEQEYHFAAPGKHNQETFDVWSIGPDGQDGSEDDVGNWES